MSPNAALLLSVLIAVYFLPAIIASTRRHRQKLAISVLNILAGWTLIGWIVAFVWACTADVLPKPPVTPIRSGRLLAFVGISVGLVFIGVVAVAAINIDASRQTPRTTYCNSYGACYSK